MLGRHAAWTFLDGLHDTPVVYLQGARQTGKTTLVRAIAGEQHPARYLTLDAAAVLAAAQDDPEGFITGLERPVVIDEVQRAPAVALAIKLAVDADRRPGQFLLTGSSSIMSLPRLAESLAGRMELHTLWPFSQGELAGVRETFIDRVFAADLPAPRNRSGSRPGPGDRSRRSDLQGGLPRNPCPEKRRAEARVVRFLRGLGVAARPPRSGEHRAFVRDAAAARAPWRHGPASSSTSRIWRVPSPSRKRP